MLLTDLFPSFPTKSLYEEPFSVSREAKLLMFIVFFGIVGTALAD